MNVSRLHMHRRPPRVFQPTFSTIPLLLRLCWPGLFAAFCYLVAVNVTDGAGVPVVLVCLASSIVVGPLLSDYFLDAPSGVRAPAHLQLLADSIAHDLGVAPRPVLVSGNENGLASVRGVRRKRQRIEVAMALIDTSVPTTRAILAHELSHVASHHQFFSALGALVSWATPAAVAALAVWVLPGHPSLWVIGFFYSAATVASVLAWCHAMREQELRADALAATCPGVREELAAHLTQMASRGWDEQSDSISALLSLHPTCTLRVERLRGVPASGGQRVS